MHDSLDVSEAGSAKRRQILQGAQRVFVECGFEGASVNEIALRAGVSKATLYNHFPDKGRLFRACIEDHCTHFQEQVEASLVAHSGTIESALQAIGERFVTIAMSPEAVAFFRMVVAESARQPEVAKHFYDTGPKCTNERLAAVLMEAVRRGELHIEDPMHAAQQFVALCQTDIAMRLFLSVDLSLSDVERQVMVGRAVRTFLRAYAP